MPNRDYDDQLLQALSELSPSDESEPIPDAVNGRICRLALQKIQLSAGQAAVITEPDAEPEQDEKIGRKVTMDKHSQKGKVGTALNRALRISLIAAAILCGSAVTVCAVGPQLLTMLGGKIGFFDEAPSQSEVEDPVEAPRTNFVENQKKLEAYNAAIGETVTDNGVSITLDNISMDVTSMDIFLTISGEEAIDAIMGEDDYGPLWNRFFGVGPHFFDPQINGESIAQYDVEDWYLNDDGSLKLWRHYILTDIPEGDEITVKLEDNSALGREGHWAFTVTLDGASVRAGARLGKPADYTLQPLSYEMDGKTYTNNRNLYLKYLAFGPVGGVLWTGVNENQIDDPDGGSTIVIDGMNAGSFYITDNTGKELYASKSTAIGGAAVNLTAPDENATSITFTPVVSQGYEVRTVSLDELKNGVKIATSPIGGYTVQNFTIKDGTICYDLQPYGWAANSASGTSPEILRPQYDGKITEVEEEVTNLQDGGTATFLKSGLLSSTVDPQTGVVSVRHDFYAATDEELETITEWKYSYAEAELDTENAVTVPLASLDDLTD